MKHKKSILFMILFMIVFFSAIGRNWSIDTGRSYDNKIKVKKLKIIIEKSLETQYITQLSSVLSEQLWTARDTYDSCHYLMLPLHYSFRNDNFTSCREDFKKMFSKFLKDDKEEFYQCNALAQNHFIYLCSEYLLLCTIYEEDELFLKKLYDFCLEEIMRYCNNYKGNWSAGIQYQNLYDVLDGILYGNGYGMGLSTDYAITDNDLFPLAIMCDLYEITKKTGGGDYRNIELAPQYSYEIIKKYSSWNQNGGWLFQEGVWTDYSDYQFAAVEDEKNIKKEEKVKNVVSDSSHFMRFPLFLKSFQIAQAEEEKSMYFQKVRDGLKLQFTKKVLCPPDIQCDYYRLNTYMNGQNGYFQGKYDKDGKLTGCGPYSLSSALLLGWWSFLEDEEIGNIYLYTYNKFPFNKKGEEVYKDRMTDREQNPKLINESWKEMLCWMAGNF